MEKHGHTAGCPGCKAAERGTAAANHTEECRKRIGEELEKVGDERLERETDRQAAGKPKNKDARKKRKTNKGTRPEKEEHRRQAGQQRAQEKR